MQNSLYLTHFFKEKPYLHISNRIKIGPNLNQNITNNDKHYTK